MFGCVVSSSKSLLLWTSYSKLEFLFDISASDNTCMMEHQRISDRLEIWNDLSTWGNTEI